MDLAANVSMVQPKGGLIFGIVTEGSNPSIAASKSELNAWISSEMAPNTWVVEQPGAPSSDGAEAYFASGRDTYVTIDLSNMKILRLSHDDEATALADFKSRLP